MNDWLFISNIVSLIFSVLAFIAGVGCIAYTIGLRNSTHQISYVPLGKKAKDGGNVAEDDEDFEEDLEEPINF
jgi:hypothetical protein